MPMIRCGVTFLVHAVLQNIGMYSEFNKHWSADEALQEHG
jgi:hypothetical protein